MATRVVAPKTPQVEGEECHPLELLAGTMVKIVTIVVAAAIAGAAIAVYFVS